MSTKIYLPVTGVFDLEGPAVVVVAAVVVEVVRVLVDVVGLVVELGPAAVAGLPPRQPIGLVQLVLA